MRQVFSGISLLLLITQILFFVTAIAADKKTPPNFESSQLRLKLFPRSTDQMAGFFEARGFPPSMIQQLSRYCFFTVVIKNKADEKLWLDLSDWEFMAGSESLSRLPRSKWPPLWNQLNIPLAAQSTFRWTLLPETLQFYAQESEGGNIILQKTNLPFTLRAKFGVGIDNVQVIASVNNLRCADAVEEE